ncbi:hypothetical protein [Nostoc sp.]|uniref:hypothetical protein n=1 Tax=Nostoc sp. TaxID=1180 RepID=UPI002FF8A307
MKFKRIGASLRDATRTPSRRVGTQRIELKRSPEESALRKMLVFVLVRSLCWYYQSPKLKSASVKSKRVLFHLKLFGW